MGRCPSVFPESPDLGLTSPKGIRGQAITARTGWCQGNTVTVHTVHMDNTLLAHNVILTFSTYWFINYSKFRNKLLTCILKEL